MTASPAGSTVDAFLGGKLEAVQMAHGHHRSGLEAVLLSAAIDAGFQGTVADLGAGVGVAGMAIAARCQGAKVVLVERDPDAIECARASLALPANADFADRVTVAAVDITAPESERAAGGLDRTVADAVVMNPPFHREHTGTASPNASRAAAHTLEDTGLEPWLRAAASALKPAGRLIVIFRADQLEPLLASLAGRFGGVAVLPLHAREKTAAHRVLVRADKGRRAPFRLLPALVLHQDSGHGYQPAVEKILRQGASLSEVHAVWG